MTVFSDLCAAPAGPTSGVPVAYGTWRFFVRIAKATTSAVLGTFILGTDRLTPLVWVDVTADFAGGEIQRGGQIGSMPSAGSFKFRLNNVAGAYNPSASIYNGPGSLVQIGFYTTAAETLILCTTITTAWKEATDNTGKVKVVDIESIETLFLFGENDENAVAIAGTGESIGPRVLRLLDAARWQFGGTVNVNAPHFSWGLQGTVLSSDTWTELQLTAQSLAVIVKSSKTGGLLVTERDGGYLATYHTADTDFPVVADSVKTSNDDLNIISNVSVARAGGTAQAFTSPIVGGRYQRRSHKFYNLITQDPGADADLIRYKDDRFAQGNKPYRVSSFNVDRLNGNTVLEFIARMDLGTRINVNKKNDTTGAHGVLFSNFLILGYTIAIEPYKTTDIRCRATVQTEPSATATWGTY